MKEKEEAERIVKMFEKAIKEKAVISNPVKFAAKQCALIHVEGMLILALKIDVKTWVYWQEVKTNIEKL